MHPNLGVLAKGHNGGVARASSPRYCGRMSKFHDFEMNSITGESVNFGLFADKVCLIVNVASF